MKMTVRPGTFSRFSWFFLASKNVCFPQSSDFLLEICSLPEPFVTFAGSGQMSWCRDSELLGSFGRVEKSWRVVGLSHGWEVLKSTDLVLAIKTRIQTISICLVGYVLYLFGYFLPWEVARLSFGVGSLSDSTISGLEIPPLSGGSDGELKVQKTTCQKSALLKEKLW